MRALLIDPFRKTITPVSISSTEEVAGAVGSENLSVTALTPQDHLVVAADAVEKPGMRFWLLGSSEMPIAGRALIRGNSLDGLQAEPIHLDELLLRQRVQFLDVKFVGWETVPRFDRLTDADIEVPAPPPANGPAEPSQKGQTAIWTITEDEAGYTASLTSVEPSGKAKATGVRLENEDLEELRTMLPKGLTRLDRTDKDDPSIVETWFSLPN